MINYRLKKEAVPFFNEKYATSIYCIDTWEGIGIDMNALEEVGEPYLAYGHQTGENSGTLSGWSKGGSHFCFTIYFPSVKHYEHDKFNKGRITRDLMNKIQSIIDNYFSEFINQSELQS
jgi:hypothetical protein